MTDSQEVHVDFEGIDLSGIKDPREPVPHGNYVLTVVEADLTTSKAGDPMYAMVYEVVEGEKQGKRIFDYAVLAGKGKDMGLWRIRQLAEKASLPLTKLPKPEELINKFHFTAEVSVQPGQGEYGPSNNVKNIL